MIEIRTILCTCPDASVEKGQNYLRLITPDSLKKYNLDYSEIYLTGNTPKFPDSFSNGPFIIKGKIVGKKRVSVESDWNPLFKIKSWDDYTQ